MLKEKLKLQELLALLKPRAQRPSRPRHVNEQAVKTVGAVGLALLVAAVFATLDKPVPAKPRAPAAEPTPLADPAPLAAAPAAMPLSQGAQPVASQDASDDAPDAGFGQQNAAMQEPAPEPPPEAPAPAPVQVAAVPEPAARERAPPQPSTIASSAAAPLACLPAPLRDVLAGLESQFGNVTVVSTTHLHTDNHSRGSARARMHAECKAVDIRTTSDPKKVVAYLRSRPEVAGVNSYRNKVVHFDLNPGYARASARGR